MILGGLGNSNRDEKCITDLAVSLDLAIANIFCKKQEHLIIYKGGNTQIDYLMYRRSHVSEIKDYKVIPGGHATPQHSLLVMNLTLRLPKKGKKKYQKRIRWISFKEKDKRGEFKVKVLERISTSIEGVEDWWREMQKQQEEYWV